MRNYTELEKKLAADRELVRCKDEFAKLCSRLPNLPPTIATFGILMDYFPDTMQFDVLSGLEAIKNDQQFAKRLGYRDDEDIAIANKKSVDEANKHTRSLSSDELHAQLRARDAAFLAKYGKKKPGPEVTREAFLKATRAQRNEWVERHTFEGLNEHWRQQAEEAGNV